jgi:hypothetical protein
VHEAQLVHNAHPLWASGLGTLPSFRMNKIRIHPRVSLFLLVE